MLWLTFNKFDFGWGYASASEMTCIVSSGALNSTHSLTHWGYAPDPSWGASHSPMPLAGFKGTYVYGQRREEGRGKGTRGLGSPSGLDLIPQFFSADVHRWMCGCYTPVPTRRKYWLCQCYVPTNQVLSCVFQSHQTIHFTVGQTR